LRRANATFRVLGLIALVALGLLGLQGFDLYKDIFSSNTTSPKGKSHQLKITKGTSLTGLSQQLLESNIIEDGLSFERVARLMKFTKVKGGSYDIAGDMSNRELIRKLRAGKQTPIRIMVKSSRHLDQVVENLTEPLQADANTVMSILQSDSLKSLTGFDQANVISLFLPDTYEFYWNTDEVDLLKRMKKEYDKYWSKERKAKARALGITPSDAIILASIVDEETAKVDEMDDIAGVYLNRLKKGMRLQADPTVKYAVGDWAIKRVLDKHLAKKSPYNTYINTGLPPGPIRLPSKQALEQVLNPAKHKYFYFCAKEDFSGYHNFSRTLSEHNAHARRYRNQLTQRGIR